MLFDLNLTPGTRNQEPGTRNPEPETRNPKHKTRNWQLATRNPESETPNPRRACPGLPRHLVLERKGGREGEGEREIDTRLAPALSGLRVAIVRSLFQQVFECRRGVLPCPHGATTLLKKST